MKLDATPFVLPASEANLKPVAELSTELTDHNLNEADL